MTQEYREDNDRNVNVTDNRGFLNATALQYRLDTAEFINQVEQYLRGQVSLPTFNEEGIPVINLIAVGQPICNDTGIMHILNYVTMMVNRLVVQGNAVDWDHYAGYMERQRKGLAKYIMVNLYNWDFNIKYYSGFLDGVFGCVEMFISRTLFDKERQSYANTIRSVETNTNQVQGGRSWKLPFMR